jgi:hypothetical protein
MTGSQEYIYLNALFTRANLRPEGMEEIAPSCMLIRSVPQQSVRRILR